MPGFNPSDDGSSSSSAYTQLSDLSPHVDAPSPYQQPLPTPTVSLPPGWREYFTEDGLPYYVNSQTNATQ